MMVAAAALAAFGSIIGSFLNVVVYRIPAGRSIVSPPSACGACGHPVRAYDNVPVLSWVLLRARCRDCGARISVRYPLVELGTAVLFAVVAIRFVPAVLESTSAGDAVAAVLVVAAFLYLGAISLALALIDIDVHRLPDVIVLPAYAVGPALLGGASLLTGDPWAIARAGLGLVILGGVYLLLAVARPGGMGFGDVKLAGVLGFFLAWLGWDAFAVGALAAFILGGLFGLALIAVRRAGRTSQVPFGPWMLGGAWLGILVGAPIARAYLSLFGWGEP